MKVKALFFHVGFLDLVCDALFHLRLAESSDDSYVINRHARASILACSLSLECLSNALIKYLDTSEHFYEDLERLPPLSKIEAFLKIAGVGFDIDRGNNRTQKMKELIQVRNQFVHPKESKISTEIGMPEDGNENWIVPMSLEGNHYKELAIPRCSLFWSAVSALKVIQSTFEFYQTIFSSIEKNHKDALRMTMNRLEFKNFCAPNTFNEFDLEIASAKAKGLKVEFLIKLCSNSE